MKIDGACQCGHISYEAEANEARVAICHCNDCQHFSGAPYRASIPARVADFKFLSGEPTVYVKTAESGNKRAQAFCPRCGSPIYAADAVNPSHYNIRLGTIRQRDQLNPSRQIWMESKQHWVDGLKDIPGILKDKD